MAWMMSVLFVERPRSQRAVEACLGQILGAQAKAEHLRLLGPPPPVSISPIVEGWQRIAQLAPWVSALDQSAKALAAEADRVICCELIGNAFLLRISEYRPGQAAPSVLQSPAALPWGQLDEFTGPMPLYEDVEERAYATLRGLRIPAGLLRADTLPVGSTTSEALPGATKLSLDADASVLCEEHTLHIPLPAIDAAPMSFRSSSKDFGLTLVDERYVQGRPSSASVRRLIELQQQLRRRLEALTALPRINLNLAYHAGSFQPALDQLLREQGQPVAPDPRRPTPPWWAFWRYFGAGWRKGG